METFAGELRRLTVEGPIAAEAERRRKAELKIKKKQDAVALAEKRFEDAVTCIDRALRSAAARGQLKARFDISDEEGVNRIALSGPYELVDDIHEVVETRKGTNPKWNFVLRTRKHYESLGLEVKVFAYTSSYGSYIGPGGWHILFSWKSDSE